MNSLQQDALKKYTAISQGNGSDKRIMPLIEILKLIQKTEPLTNDDVTVLNHFLMATKKELAETSFLANTVFYPNSWNHETIILHKKITIKA